MIGGLDRDVLFRFLDHEHEAIRAWAIRLLTDRLPIDSIFSRRIGPDVEPPADLLAKLTRMARDDSSGLVRLVLASTLQRLPVARRSDLARALLSHGEDNSDHNLPALIWTGLIPMADSDSDAVAIASLASDCRQSALVRLIARRLGEEIDSRPAPLNALWRRLPPGRLNFVPTWLVGLSTPWLEFARPRSLRHGTGFKPGSTRTRTCGSPSACGS